MKQNSTTDNQNKMETMGEKLDGAIQYGKEEVKGKFDRYAGIGMAGAESARESLSHLTENISSRVQHAVEEGLERVKSTSEDARAIVKKYPLYTVAGVVAVSFVAGMIYGKTSSRR